MREPIAGVAPSDAAETTVLTVWPSIAMYPSARWMGQRFLIRWPDIYIFRVGSLLALLSIPYALFLYFCRLAPKTGTRYRLTNRRMIVERGLLGEPERSVAYEDFDEIKIDVIAGQQWYDAGDLVCCRAGEEVFRLQGVSRPEPYRQTCLKARQAHCSVAEVRRRQKQPSVA